MSNALLEPLLEENIRKSDSVFIKEKLLNSFQAVYRKI